MSQAPGNPLPDCINRALERNGLPVACHGAPGRSRKISALEISCKLLRA